jgi:hypothetical protein
MKTALAPRERRAAERERVDAACRALLCSQGWQQWVRARSIFHSYSLRNQLLISLQAPEATRVAGFHAWRRLGRQVRKGEKSIRILAPLRAAKHARASDHEPTPTREHNPQRYASEHKPVLGYRSVGVFDLTQTDPILGTAALRLEPPSSPINGHSHAHLLPGLSEHAASLGYSVEYRETSGCDGYCDTTHQLIVVNAQLAANAQVRVLIHELCHAHGADYATYERAACEVIVDCATHIACSTLGLDVSGETIPYIAGWGETEHALEAVITFASVIDNLAARLEHALQPLPTQTT